MIESMLWVFFIVLTTIIGIFTFIRSGKSNEQIGKEDHDKLRKGCEGTRVVGRDLC